jgi:peptidyl-prolyl cis-trans isomerase C
MTIEARDSGAFPAQPGPTHSALWRRIIREPLVHFLILGALIFLVDAWRGTAVDPASRTIIIDRARVAALAEGWQQSWQRPPTPREMDGLIADAVKEEIYYREAIRLGLDQDDPGIRRRLRLKMEELAGAQVDAAQPSDATLRAWIARSPARYAADARYSFDQIYLGSAAGEDVRAEETKVRRALAAGTDWRSLGQRISLPQTANSIERSAAARDFGNAFAAGLAKMPPSDAWQGPVASGFGLHLVRMRRTAVADPPELAEVRQAAENDWRAETRAARQNAAYRALLDGYTVRIAP